MNSCRYGQALYPSCIVCNFYTAVRWSSHEPGSVHLVVGVYYAMQGCLSATNYKLSSQVEGDGCLPHSKDCASDGPAIASLLLLESGHPGASVVSTTRWVARHLWVRTRCLRCFLLPLSILEALHLSDFVTRSEPLPGLVSILQLVRNKLTAWRSRYGWCL